MNMTHGATGLFISFEGIDGCGKTTQIERLSKRLSDAGYPVVLTKNPGGTELGKTLRQLLLHSKGFVSSTAELMLYLADRAQHTEELVRPTLESGGIVLCDRHMDSTFAYQGYGRGLSLDLIQQLNDAACQGTYPTLTFLFDADPELLHQRVIQSRGTTDRIEQAGQAFRQRVRDGFLQQAAQFPQRIHRLDALQSIEELHQAVWEKTRPYLASCVSKA